MTDLARIEAWLADVRAGRHGVLRHQEDVLAALEAAARVDHKADNGRLLHCFGDDIDGPCTLCRTLTALAKGRDDG